MLEDIAEALSQTGISQFIGDLDNSVYVLQTVHILAIASLMLSVVIIALRTIGILGPSLDLGREIERHRSYLFASLGVLVVTGILLVLSDPNRTILTTAFKVKMVLVLVFAAASTVLFRTRSAKDPSPEQPGGHVRIYSFVALPLIVAIIFLGRWIGYS